MISILDYGCGNVSSISRMICLLGGDASYISTAGEIETASKIILPGVGHFDRGMVSLNRHGLKEALYQQVLVKGTPVLGICLGMQLLCRTSEEGTEKGLGFLDADVRKFSFSPPQTLKVPHMGWNEVRVVRDNPVLLTDGQEQRFYFVHSFHVVPDDLSVIIGSAEYGYEFCAAFQRGNIFGVQFHPEKSHRFGMALMKRFIEL